MKHLLLAGLMLGILASPAWSDDAVPDAATAIKIATKAFKAKVGETRYAAIMNGMEWHAEVHGDVWSVSPTMTHATMVAPCDGHADGQCVLVQMGGWLVLISREDGDVRVDREE